MSGVDEQRATCPHCGRTGVPVAGACPACGAALTPARAAPADTSEWASTRDSLKTKWVVSVVVFWVTAVILVAAFLIEGRWSLPLTSLALGILVIGIWLKTRYQAHMRRQPPRR